MSANKTFCVLPWIHLASHPHGGVTLCCVSDHTHAINRARNFLETSAKYLDLNNDTLLKIMNSDYYRDTRLKMLNGEEVEACKRCYREEHSGSNSKRVEVNRQFSDFTETYAKAHTHEDGSITPEFRFVELRLGNLCNVKCRTCNPASSSSWTTEYQELQHALPFITKYDSKIDSSWTDSDQFWDDLLSKSKSIELLYINGGEPTLVEKHWHYLQRLIDAGLNKQIKLWYNINMTNLPDKLVDLWSQFKAVEVSASIDDLYERNEYIRTGTKWVDVEANLNKLQSLPWIKTNICQTISWLNVYTLKEFHDYMRARKLHVHLNLVHDPKFLSISILPKLLLIEAIRNAQLDNEHTNRLMGMVKLQPNAEDELTLSQGLQYNNTLDAIRNTKFAFAYPKWSTLLING